PYYDFVRQIAGDQIELTMVIPAGMDSHSFEPTPADILTIQNADILVCNGGEMEQWLEQVLEAIDPSGMTVLSMMDYVDTVKEEQVEGMELGKDAHHAHATHEAQSDIEYDEHIWTSPVNAMKIVRVLSDTLQQADAANRDLYETNTRRYLSELEQLHQDFLQVVKDEKRNLIIIGDKFPFRYLADTYGFFYRAAFSGCSTDTEPSAKTIAYLIDQVREQQIPVIYYPELSSHRVAEIICEETGAKPLLLHSCHNVSRAEFDGGITYLELMKQNAKNLRKGLDE
ncbi:MAG: metal ABC transporter substrate-binding protein, partial [Hungatella sp.]